MNAEKGDTVGYQIFWWDTDDDMWRGWDDVIYRLRSEEGFTQELRVCVHDNGEANVRVVALLVVG